MLARIERKKEIRLGLSEDRGRTSGQVRGRPAGTQRCPPMVRIQAGKRDVVQRAHENAAQNEGTTRPRSNTGRGQDVRGLLSRCSSVGKMFSKMLVSLTLSLTLLWLDTMRHEHCVHAAILHLRSREVTVVMGEGAGRIGSALLVTRIARQFAWWYVDKRDGRRVHILLPHLPHSAPTSIQHISYTFRCIRTVRAVGSVACGPETSIPRAGSELAALLLLGPMNVQGGGL